MMTYGRSKRALQKREKDIELAFWSVPIGLTRRGRSRGKITKSRDGGRFTNR